MACPVVDLCGKVVVVQQICAAESWFVTEKRRAWKIRVETLVDVYPAQGAMVELFVGDRVYIALSRVYREPVPSEVNHGIVGVGFVR